MEKEREVLTRSLDDKEGVDFHMDGETRRKQLLSEKDQVGDCKRGLVFIVYTEKVSVYLGEFSFSL